MKISARTRIAIGQVSLVVSVLLAAIVFGLVPDRRSAIIDGRADLTEALALRVSAEAGSADERQLAAVLRAIVNRNPQLESAAIRRVNGNVTCIGDHEAHWQPRDDDRSIETQVQVPIRVRGKRWGSVELRFSAIDGGGALGWLSAPAVKMTAFVALVTFVLFQFYLKRVLEHLDPSNAIPSRVRSALDALTEGLLILDRDQRILLANHSFAGFLEANPEELLGKRASALPWAGDEATPSSEWPWQRALREQRPQPNVLMRMSDGSGHDRVFIVNSSPVLGHDGTYRGVLASFDDVTELEEHKVELSRSRDEAEAANREKSQFLANMSHEIRTPMNAILGFTDVLRRAESTSGAQRRSYLNTIHSSGQHLLGLINDILDLSKIESGRMDVESVDCSPHRIIADVMNVLSVRAEEKGLSFQCDSDGPIPETIQSDPVRLRQVLINLAGNAIKFTEDGSVRVRASFLAEAQQVQFDVIDTGVGIAADRLEGIFDPFVQADNSVTRKFGGTGLGLAISKRFAELLGGGVHVSSVLGEGTVFSVRIDSGNVSGVPCRELTQDDLLADGGQEERIHVELPASRVLVVDDGPENQALMQVVLEDVGITPDIAENGRIALEMAAASDYDIILMDMQMPEMDGYTATRRLRERGLRIPIVALTANAMEGDEAACREAGCSGFLSKPVNIDDLLRTLAENLGGTVSMRTVVAAQDWQDTTEADDRGTAPASKEPAESRQAIISTLPIDRPKYRAIVEKFLVRLESQLADMHTAFENEQYAELADLAHWLKGSGGNVGFLDFVEPAAALEQAARAEQSEGLSDLLAQVTDVAGRIVLPTPATETAS